MKNFAFTFFKSIYGFVFATIMFTLLFLSNIAYSGKKEFLLSNTAIFCLGIALLAVGIILYCRCRNKSFSIKISQKLNVDMIVAVATVVLFLGQLFVFYNAFFLTAWDARMIRNFVDGALQSADGSPLNWYFSRYPNNLLLSYLYLFLLKINRLFSVFDGSYTYMCVVMLNCVINSFSCYLSYKTAKIFVSPFFALTAFLLSVFSIGISGWSIICYSDAAALFFPILSVYLYCREYKNEKTKMLGFISSIGVSALGYFIKPQCLFPCIAVVILEVLRLFGKFDFKKLLRPVAAILAVFLVFTATNVTLDLLNKKYNVQINEEQKYGFAHFLMMGANERTNGVYADEDISFSASFATTKERNKANIDLFKKRITNMENGLVNHARRKILTTFNNGTFAWGTEGSFFLDIPENNNIFARFLKSIYQDGHRFIYFATFQHAVWIFILSCSLLTVLSKMKNRNANKLTVFWIVLLGFVLYELLFEVRARYVYIFVPLFCVLAPIGIKAISEITLDTISKIKKSRDNKTCP